MPTTKDALEFLHLVERMAPDMDARRGFRALYEQAADDGTNSEQIVALLAFRLVDGLRFGNWPDEGVTKTRDFTLRVKDRVMIRNGEWTLVYNRLAGLYRCIRNNAATDDDVTVWCRTPEDALDEARKMTSSSGDGE